MSGGEINLIVIPSSVLTTSASSPPPIPQTIWVKFRRPNPEVLRQLSNLEVTPQILNLRRDVWVGLQGTDIQPLPEVLESAVPIRFLPDRAVQYLFSLPILSETRVQLPSDRIVLVPQFPVTSTGDNFIVELSVPFEDLSSSQIAPVTSGPQSSNCVCPDRASPASPSPELSVYHYIMPGNRTRQNWTS